MFQSQHVEENVNNPGSVVAMFVTGSKVPGESILLPRRCSVGGAPRIVLTRIGLIYGTSP